MHLFRDYNSWKAQQEGLDVLPPWWAAMCWEKDLLSGLELYMP